MIFTHSDIINLNNKWEGGEKMPYYIYNKNRWDGKYHEVHETTCSHLPTNENQEDLGWHLNCQAAIREAERRTGAKDFDGCHYCSDECHHG